MARNQRDYNLTWVLSLVLGHFGVDRFYLGKIGTGIVKLLTGGGFGFWYIIDLVIILTGRMRDADGRELAGYDKYKYLSWIVVAGVIFAGLVIGFIGFWISLLVGLLHGQLNLHMGHWL